MLDIQNTALDLGSKVFDLIGTDTVPESAGTMALAIMTAQETAAQVAFQGTAAAEADEAIDARAVDYVPFVVECGTAAEVVAYFDALDNILTDASGRSHVKWLAVAADCACKALALLLSGMDTLPANLAEAVSAYGNNA